MAYNTMENDNKSNLSERLKFALKILGISQTELARRIKVKPQIVQYLCAGKSEKSKFMFDIAEALEIDVLWLATGKGEVPSVSGSVKNEKKISVFSFNQVKEWKILHKDIDLTNTEKIPIHGDKEINFFAVVLNDQSMAPRFNLGTIVIIDPDFDPLKIQQNNRFVLVYLADEDFLVFRQLNIDEDKKIIVPINNNLYKSVLLKENDRILGVCKEARWST